MIAFFYHYDLAVSAETESNHMTYSIDQILPALNCMVARIMWASVKTKICLFIKNVRREKLAFKRKIFNNLKN